MCIFKYIICVEYFLLFQSSFNRNFNLSIFGVPIKNPSSSGDEQANYKNSPEKAFTVIVCRMVEKFEPLAMRTLTIHFKWFRQENMSKARNSFSQLKHFDVNNVVYLYSIHNWYFFFCFWKLKLLPTEYSVCYSVAIFQDCFLYLRLLCALFICFFLLLLNLCLFPYSVCFFMCTYTEESSEATMDA